MSLIDDIKRHYEEYSYPPDGPDLDYDFVDGKWVERTDGIETQQVSYEVLDSAVRWGNSVQVVYRRGDSYAAVRDIEPATEMQDWGDYGSPDIFEVKPVEVTVTNYIKV